MDSNLPAYSLDCLGYNSTKEKVRLQNVMAFGRDLEPGPKAVGRQPLAEEEEADIDRFAEVLGEIEERRQFLEDMTALGQDKPYRNKITAEISQVGVIDHYEFKLMTDCTHGDGGYYSFFYREYGSLKRLIKPDA